MSWSGVGSRRRGLISNYWRWKGATGPSGGPRPTAAGRASPGPSSRPPVATGSPTGRARAMRNPLILDLADCTEYRQALLARPPRVAHGTLILVVALLGTALAWSALTEADL